MNRLADILRPSTLDEVIGQEQITTQLKRQLSQGNLINTIIFGPSGTGKSSIIKSFKNSLIKKGINVYYLNGATITIDDFKNILKDLDTLQNHKGCVVILDEAHLVQKKTQQKLLPFIENGQITLYSTTTENPYTIFHQGIISRCQVYQMNYLSKETIEKGVTNALDKYNNMNNTNLSIDEDALRMISNMSGTSDLRQALNTLEVCIMNVQSLNKTNIDMEIISEVPNSKDLSAFSEETLYNTMSCLQKSIRGGDVDASVYFLALALKMCSSEKDNSFELLLRRLEVIAAEDIGLAEPQAIIMAKASTDIARNLGVQEARMSLANLVIFMASCEKSSTGYKAINLALKDIENGLVYDFPNHLKNRNKRKNPKDKYLNPHNYPKGSIQQQYLPSELNGKKYYNAGDNKKEQALKKALENQKRPR